MVDSIAKFFEAWRIESAEERRAKIASAVAQDIQYDDPRTTVSVVGIDALSDYVGMFSANAPGWSAKVIKSDTIAGVARVTVVFGGEGPDGSQQAQHGEYFVESDGELVTRMVGFVGTGEIK